MSTATEIPTHFDAGESVEYRVEYPDFPASDGWALKLWLNGGDPADPKALSKAATADGAGFKISLSGTDTAPLTAGRYGYAHRATKGGEVRDVETGILMVGLNMATAPAGAALSKAEKRLAKVRAKMDERIELGWAQYQLLNRGVTYDPLPDWQRLEADLVAQVNTERRGGAPRESIRYRFRRPA